MVRLEARGSKANRCSCPLAIRSVLRVGVGNGSARQVEIRLLRAGSWLSDKLTERDSSQDGEVVFG